MMKPRQGVRQLSESITTYQGRVHNRDAGGKHEVIAGMRMSMNPVTIGHVVFSRATETVQEERERVRTGLYGKESEE